MLRRFDQLPWRTLWVGCWTVAFVLTHIPISPRAHAPIPQLDKVAHFSMYFAITFLGGMRLRKAGSVGSIPIILWALGYLVYGALDEITQPYTGRDADVADWAFDALGVGMASLILWWGVRKSTHPGSRPR